MSIESKERAERALAEMKRGLRAAVPEIIEPMLRRRLAKAGYGLKKTPARSKDRELYGVGYMVFDRATNMVVLGATHRRCDASLEDVVDFAAREGT